MNDKKNNPYVTMQTCKAYREGTSQRFDALETLIDEKFKNLTKTVAIVGGVTTIIVGLVQLFLSF